MNPLGKTLILASGTIFLTFCLIAFPDQALDASVRGLDIWWEVVFPSLLPFFITAELLIGFGVVTFLGVLFEPIMRPIFNVPGVGSFAWVMGMASGYPSGAKISTRLREEGQLTRIEAERLLSFTNASSPLFIFGAIAVGFFHDPKLGLLIAVCHYLGNMIVGICMRFYGSAQENHPIKKARFSMKRALKEMHNERINDPRPFGEVIGDAVLNSIKTLVMVGGFIILFSVLTRMFFLIGILAMLAQLLQFSFSLLSLPIELGVPFLTGLFEITLGAQLVSKTTIDLMLAKIIIVSFILGFNGFSVQAQVSSIIAKTDIRFTPYFVSRLLHGLFASLLTIILYKPLYVKRKLSEASTIPGSHHFSDDFWHSLLIILKQIGPLLTITAVGLAISIKLYRMYQSN